MYRSVSFTRSSSLSRRPLLPASGRDPLILSSPPAPAGWCLPRGWHGRCWSVRELATLQGFPPDYLLCGTRGDQIKQIGNAVHVGMGERVIRAVLGHLLPDRTGGAT